MSRVGVLGGSFDPPHAGHLMIAQEAGERVGLDRVLFVPAGEQWLKEGQDVAPATHRLAMTHLLVGAEATFAVSDVEVTRPGPSYTVDTLRILREESPPDTEFFFILGEDAVADLPRWHRPQELVSLCEFIAMPRMSQAGRPDLTAAYAAIPGLRDKVTILEDAPRMDISSSRVRQLLASGSEPSRRRAEPGRQIHHRAPPIRTRRGSYSSSVLRNPSSLRQRGRVLAHRVNITGRPSRFSMSGRTRTPTSLSDCPPFPTTMPL